VQFRDNIWQWMRTDFGQTVLIKQRNKIRALPKGSWPATRSVIDASAQHTVSDSVSDSYKNSEGAAIAAQRRTPRRGGQPEQLGLDDTGGMSAPVATRPEADPTNEADAPPKAFDRAHNQGMNVDRILAWTASRHFSEDALGYALRRLAEGGTIEQVIAFSVAVHAAAQRSSLRDERR